MPEFTIFTFGRFSICCDEREITPLPRHGDTLCQMLLSQPGRRASYSWLIDQIWPLSDGDRAIEYLYAAATHFRTATSTDLLLTNRQTQSYELAGQDRLWVDADAALALLTEADALGRTTAQALPLFEQAVQYFRRGRFLAGVEETWVQARRLHLEMMKERALLALAEAYVQQGKRQQAETLLSEALSLDSTNENLLRTLMQLFHEEGMTHQALRAYEQFTKALKKTGLEPAEATTALYERLKRAPRVLDLPALPTTAPLSLPSSSLSDQHQEHTSQTRETTEPFTISAGTERAQTTLFPLFTQAIKQGILQAAGELEGDTMDRLRRQLVGHVLTGTGAALLASYPTASHSDTVERLAKALTGPSHVDETTLRYLERHTANYWQDRHQAVIASPDLFGYVLEHLEKIIALLEQSLLPQERLRLCALASQTAQLAGHLLFDMSAYQQARRFHATAIMAAHEADDMALEATAWARMSFTWTYSGHAQEALTCIQRASDLASGKTNATTQAYLAAVEAEIQSLLGEQTACLEKLNEAERWLRDSRPEENTCWLRFDRSRLAGYQGICFQNLYQSENPQTASFLIQAQATLQDALACLSPTLIQRRPALLIDLAGTYTRQGEIEEACSQAIQAMEVIECTKSQAAIQRLLKLRQAFEPWQQTPYVKRLDERIEALLISNHLQKEIKEG